MDRTQLKQLSWEQIKDKIWMLFLISLIISLISNAAAGFLGSIIGIPVGFVAGLLGAASDSPERALSIISLASSFASMVSSVLSLFISAPFSFSAVIVYLKVVNNTTPDIADAFSGFKKYWRAVGVYFFNSLFIGLWSMLFIIPGIVKTYSYAMAPYIAEENPDISPLDCITKSKEMMDGHKWDLFVLDLSFIGWALLTVISFGIAGIWYVPYANAAHANFYKQLKGEL